MLSAGTAIVKQKSLIGILRENFEIELKNRIIYISKAASFFIAAVFMFSSCNRVEDDVLPAMPVNVDLSDVGIWNVYGVFGFGTYRYFVRDMNKPAGFVYGGSTATGYGGILLVGGMDPFQIETCIPMAYDMSCPVEKNRNIRIYFDEDNLAAVCEKCGSRFDVTMQGGAPISGLASQCSPKVGLRRYQVLQTMTGGYVIVR